MNDKSFLRKKGYPQKFKQRYSEVLTLLKPWGQSQPEVANPCIILGQISPNPSSPLYSGLYRQIFYTKVAPICTDTQDARALFAIICRT